MKIEVENGVVRIGYEKVRGCSWSMCLYKNLTPGDNFKFEIYKGSIGQLVLRYKEERLIEMCFVGDEIKQIDALNKDIEAWVLIQKYVNDFAKLQNLIAIRIGEIEREVGREELRQEFRNLINV
jgi:hypothetical protein